MVPRTHDNGPSIMPGAPKAPHPRTPLSSPATTPHRPLATSLREILINGPAIRNRPNSRRITANLFSNRKFFTHFVTSSTPPCVLYCQHPPNYLSRLPRSVARQPRCCYSCDERFRRGRVDGPVRRTHNSLLRRPRPIACPCSLVHLVRPSRPS